MTVLFGSDEPFDHQRLVSTGSSSHVQLHRLSEVSRFARARTTAMPAMSMLAAIYLSEIAIKFRILKKNPPQLDSLSSLTYTSTALHHTPMALPKQLCIHTCVFLHVRLQSQTRL